jgi:hypothetical protein
MDNFHDFGPAQPTQAASAAVPMKSMPSGVMLPLRKSCQRPQWVDAVEKVGLEVAASL